jgi:hypothetical protein
MLFVGKQRQHLAIWEESPAGCLLKIEKAAMKDKEHTSTGGML